jgi:hypothetical protein
MPLLQFKRKRGQLKPIIADATFTGLWRAITAAIGRHIF